jgi:hypothetical protein
MELVSSKRFDIANDAFDWAELNYKGLVWGMTVSFAL